jgi:hypothetical protein
MTTMVTLRLRAYLNLYVAIAPTLTGLILLAVLYGGGVARAEEAYGVSAVVLFPVLAWQTKILLDAEPDLQRRLFRVAAGSAHREIGAGLLAAAITAVPTIALAMLMPWIFSGVGSVAVPGQPEPLGLGGAVAVGIWAHLLAVAPAVGVGAWASRPITRTAGTAITVLVGTTVLAIVLGLNFSPIPWVAPPLLPTARAANLGASTVEMIALTLWAALWGAVAIWGYWRLRLRRV